MSLTSQKRRAIDQYKLQELAPGVYPFTGFVAYQFDCTHIIGCGSGDKLAQFHPLFNIIGIKQGDSASVYQNRYGFAKWMSHDFDQPGQLSLPVEILRKSAIICDNVIGQLNNPAHFIENLKTWLDYSPVCILSSPEKKGTSESMLDQLETMIRSNGFNVGFVGKTDGDHPSEDNLMIVIDRNTSTDDNHDDSYDEDDPNDFSVLAILTSYNEADIIEATINRLIEQGIDVYLIDNWSTDATVELASRFLDKGLLKIEKFPKNEPSLHFDLEKLLTRVEEVADEVDADWYIHHDVDEVRSSPWPGVSLKEGLYRVDRAGYNCIDHTIIEFHPIDNGFQSGTDYEDYFKHFAFSGKSGYSVKVCAWKYPGDRVALARFGGHFVEFKNSRIYPYKFLLKHYPIRSQEHGERKIFHERKPRWNQSERDVGWHTHYDYIEEHHNFLHNPSELICFDEEDFNKNYLVQRLTGIGLSK